MKPMRNYSLQLIVGSQTERLWMSGMMFPGGAMTVVGAVSRSVIH